MLCYNELRGIYKETIQFCLNNIETFQNSGINISNNFTKKLEESEITVESSPYFCIIKFYYDGFTALKFEKTYDIIIVHKSNNWVENKRIADTVVSMHFNGNLLVEIEVYNVDSSAIDLENFLTGEVSVTDSLT